MARHNVAVTRRPQCDKPIAVCHPGQIREESFCIKRPDEAEAGTQDSRIRSGRSGPRIMGPESWPAREVHGLFVWLRNGGIRLCPNRCEALVRKSWDMSHVP